ncbi:NAD(P)H-quinone oxidoreductase [Arthrobacter sp. NamB2]|uniref:NAD(P)H-quinone oxidoreductase n=1 Tax=Arthrobacter sp. NamB2 TaxID=2576035 RepID=UPI0010C973A6|nr:NAD(P)H-quinone oxidoreductase [Arthrobacter sp. NamB2]TKV27440.1 NAD(P)H-quinone oxidoreductase [Arthrobacter sp. NamB2]
MRAVVIRSAGGPEVLSVEEVAVPVRREDEVVIDVVAAGLNRADVQQRRGLYPPPEGASTVPGLEVSGYVADPGRSRFAEGDAVVALLAGGGYAEKVAVPAGQVVRAPDGVGLEEAAVLPETAATVWSNLVTHAGLSEGDDVLIHGASGGIGVMAIQVSLALGAVPHVTAGSDAKLDVARSLGVRTLINYREQDFVEELRAATDGRGADVILDVVGAKYLARNVASLATGGRLVVIGLQGGGRAELDLGALMARRASVAGTTLRARPVAEKAAIMSAVHDNVWPLVASGAVRPFVDRTFPLDQVAEAHSYFDAGKHTGKILLSMR